MTICLKLSSPLVDKTLTDTQVCGNYCDGDTFLVGALNDLHFVLFGVCSLLCHRWTFCGSHDTTVWNVRKTQGTLKLLFYYNMKNHVLWAWHEHWLCRKCSQCYSFVKLSQQLSQRSNIGSRFRKLSHGIWHCQYHILWTPKYRYRVLEGKVGEYVEYLIRAHLDRLECEVVELSVQPDHVHVLVMILRFPPFSLTKPSYLKALQPIPHKLSL